jgi:hypothetical protein
MRRRSIVARAAWFARGLPPSPIVAAQRRAFWMGCGPKSPNSTFALPVNLWPRMALRRGDRHAGSGALARDGLE